MISHKQSLPPREDRLDQTMVRSCISSGLTNEAIEEIQKFGQYIGKRLKYKENNKTKDELVTTSQIRQPFSKMKTIEAKGINSSGQWLEFMMLRPYLAYAAGRHKKEGLNILKDWAIDEVLKIESEQVTSIQSEKNKRFKNFCKFFEAILAYHRAAGGN
jgi:CRISPR-associated protein Csm2